jgi:hypothetical protein
MSNLLRNLTARGLSFAHLAKVPARAAADDPPPEDKGGKKGKSADDDNPEPDDQTRENGDGKKGKRADDDNPEPEDEDDKGGKKGKRAADDNPDPEDPDAEDDDDDEEEMSGSSASAKARRRERARCATIMGSKVSARNPVLAANLAFNSSMTRQQALATLRDTPAPTSAAPAVRRNPSLGAGGEGSGSSQNAVAASWDHAMKKARPRG